MDEETKGNKRRAHQWLRARMQGNHVREPRANGIALRNESHSGDVVLVTWVHSFDAGGRSVRDEDATHELVDLIEGALRILADADLSEIEAAGRRVAVGTVVTFLLPNDYGGDVVSGRVVAEGPDVLAVDVDQPIDWGIKTTRRDEVLLGRSRLRAGMSQVQHADEVRSQLAEGRLTAPVCEHQWMGPTGVPAVGICAKCGEERPA